MKNLPSLHFVRVENETDNEFFKAAFSRQSDGKLYGHVTFYKWSTTAKRKAIEVLDEIDEPVYAILHDLKMFKFLGLLGFVPTGNLVSKALPGREDHVFGEVVRLKTDINSYALSLYDQVGKAILPMSLVDGYGQVEKLDAAVVKMDKVVWTNTHHFSDGVYTREVFIPSGAVFTGMWHRKKSPLVMTKGACTFLTIDRQGHATDLGVLQAGDIRVTGAELRKIGFAHEDTVALNSFPLEGIPKQYHNIEGVSVLEDYLFDKEGIPCQQ